MLDTFYTKNLPKKALWDYQAFLVRDCELKARYLTHVCWDSGWRASVQVRRQNGGDLQLHKASYLDPPITTKQSLMVLWSHLDLQVTVVGGWWYVQNFWES